MGVSTNHANSAKMPGFAWRICLGKTSRNGMRSRLPRVSLNLNQSSRRTHRTQMEPEQAAPAASTRYPDSKEQPNVEMAQQLNVNLPKGTIAGGAHEISDLARRVINNEIPGNENQAVRYAIVGDEESEAIRIATGLDVKGYKHTVDSIGIRHALFQHGGKDKEVSRGQEAISQSDFARIPEIVANPDTVENAGKDSSGNYVIKYSKRYNGSIFYVEEVRSGRMELVSKTMRKMPSGVAMPGEPSRRLTPEATGGNLPQSDGSILQPNKKSSRLSQKEY